MDTFKAIRLARQTITAELEAEEERLDDLRGAYILAYLRAAALVGPTHALDDTEVDKIRAETKAQYEVVTRLEETLSGLEKLYSQAGSNREVRDQIAAGLGACA